MKNKATLFLMEQLVMVLVFALAAALCLQCFAASAGISRNTAQYDRAVQLAQSCAEVLKACRGDLETAAEILGGSAEGNTLTVHAEGCILEAMLTGSGLPGLGQAEIRVDTDRYTLTVCWQEVMP